MITAPTKTVEPRSARSAGTITTTVRTALLLTLLWAGFSAAGEPLDHSPLRQESMFMHIVIETGDGTSHAHLDDTPAAHAFATLLPLSLELVDFGGGVEKIADLPSRLQDETHSAGIAPVAGDITYYAPWGNLAIFRKDFRHSKGLVKLGRVTSGFDALDENGAISVIIKRAE